MSDSQNDEHHDDYWCCKCGDMSVIAKLEGRELDWYVVNDETNVGICSACSKALDSDQLVLPEEEEESEKNKDENYALD